MVHDDRFFEGNNTCRIDDKITINNNVVVEYHIDCSCGIVTGTDNVVGSGIYNVESFQRISSTSTRRYENIGTCIQHQHVRIIRITAIPIQTITLGEITQIDRRFSR